MRIAVSFVYVALASTACRGEVVLDDGAAGRDAGSGAGGSGAVGGRGGTAPDGGGGRGGSGRAGTGSGGQAQDGSLGSSGSAGAGGAGGSSGTPDDSGPEVSGAGGAGGSVFDAGNDVPDGCITDWGTDGGPVGTHCAYFMSPFTIYDAASKRVTIFSPSLAPPVSGSYSLSYTLATPSGALYRRSSGAVRIEGGAMVVDLSQAPDVSAHPIQNIVFCELSLRDICGVTHDYSDIGIYSDRGCAHFNLRPNADSGVNLLPECVETRACATRCQ